MKEKLSDRVKQYSREEQEEQVLDCYDEISQSTKQFKRGVLPLSEKGGKVNNSRVSATPFGLRGCNAELYEVKVFDANMNLKYIIPKEEIVAREKAKRHQKKQ